MYLLIERTKPDYDEIVDSYDKMNLKPELVQGTLLYYGLYFCFIPC